MAKLGNHPSVIHFIGAVSTQDKFYMIIEFAQNGSLLDYLKNHEVSYEQRIQFARDAAARVVHLHAEGIIHGDIAARNFLVSKELTVVVADFGMSRVVEEGNEIANRTKSNIGPFRWMAPESVKRREYSLYPTRLPISHC